MVVEIPNAKNCFPKSQPTLNRRVSKLINSIAVLINLSVPYNCDQELKLFNGLSDHSLDAQSGILKNIRQLGQAITSLRRRVVNAIRNIGTTRNRRGRRFTNSTQEQESVTIKPRPSQPSHQTETQIGSRKLDMLYGREINPRIQCLFANIGPRSERCHSRRWIGLAAIIQKNVTVAPSLPLEVSNILLDKFLKWTSKPNIEILELPLVSKYVARIFCMARDLAGGIENKDIQNLLRRIDEVSEQNQRVCIILNNVAAEIKWGRYTEEDFMRDAKLAKQLFLGEMRLLDFWDRIRQLKPEDDCNDLIMDMINENPNDPIINIKICNFFLELFDDNSFPEQMAMLPVPDIDSPSNPITALIRRARDEAVGEFEPHKDLLTHYVFNLHFTRPDSTSVLMNWFNVLTT